MSRSVNSGLTLKKGGGWWEECFHHFCSAINSVTDEEWEEAERWPLFVDDFSPIPGQVSASISIKKKKVC